MRLKEYFDAGLRSTTIYCLLGIFAGYASFLINNPRIAFVFMVVILAITTFILKRIFKVDYRWFMNNGIVAFLFIWFIVWTILYNLNVVV